MYRLAEAVGEGVQPVPVPGFPFIRWPSWWRTTFLEKHGAKMAEQVKIPIAKPEQPAEADAITFGTPTRFANMAAQMGYFLDLTGPPWMTGVLIGKVGNVFASTATQHGGQETTITSFHSTLLHHGMVIVGVPYSECRLTHMGDVSGGTPYVATTLAGPDGARQPGENELKIVRFHRKHVREITTKLFR